MNKKMIYLFMFTIGLFAQAQEESQDEFIRLYKENYLEWISSPEIAKLQKENPDIAKLIENIPIQQTRAYQEEMQRIRAGEGSNIDFEDLLEGDLVESSLKVIKELLSPENTEVVTRLYWKVIRSAETQEIADIIVGHMEKARDDIRAGSETVIGSSQY